MKKSSLSCRFLLNYYIFIKILQIFREADLLFALFYRILLLFANYAQFPASRMLLRLIDQHIGLQLFPVKERSKILQRRTYKRTVLQTLCRALWLKYLLC